MPQIPNLINLAIPGFICLLVLEAVMDAVMRRDLYQFKDTAASLAMGTGSVLLGVVSKALAFAAYTGVHRFAISISDINGGLGPFCFLRKTSHITGFTAPATNAACSGPRMCTSFVAAL